MTARRVICAAEGCDEARAGARRLPYCAAHLAERQACSFVFVDGRRCTATPQKGMRTRPLCITHYRASRDPVLAACIEPGCDAPRSGGWVDRCPAHAAERRRCSAIDEAGEPCPRVTGLRRGLCGRHYELELFAGVECASDGCERQVAARGLCSRHDRQKRRAEASPCSVDGCDALADTRGLCAWHYVPPKWAGVACIECGAQARKRGQAGPLCNGCAAAYAKWRRPVYDRHEGRCGLCGELVPYRDELGRAFDLDHIVPRDLGGADTPANLQPAHIACNRSKQKALATWRHLACGELVGPEATAIMPARGWDTGNVPEHVGCRARAAA